MKRSESIRPAPLAPILAGIAGLLLLAAANLTAVLIEDRAWPVTDGGTSVAESLPVEASLTGGDDEEARTTERPEFTKENAR